MRKYMVLFLTLTMIFALTACGNESNVGIAPSVSSTDGNGSQSGAEEESSLESDSSQSAGDSAAPRNSELERGDHILVAYFSRVGNTEWEDGVDAVTSASLTIQDGEYVGNAELLAQMVQQATGGDLFLIQTVETYPSDYRATTDVAAVEQANDARPELASHVENMDQYDIIVLIYPNWWGTLPQPLFTFLEEYDFSGKTILPLCTHGGSRMGSSESDIAALCPDATLLNGLAVSGSGAAAAQSDVEAWIINAGILE